MAIMFRPRILACLLVIFSVFFAWHVFAEDGGTGNPDPGVIPPISGATEAKVMPGIRADLAYSTATNQWLVVSETGGPQGIIGQFIDEKNKKKGGIISINPNDGMVPHIAYDPNIKKFLVLWANGDGNTVYGQFITDQGSLDGSKFVIHSGSLNLSRNSTLQFDRQRKVFVTTWQEYTGPMSATLAIIDESGRAKTYKIPGETTVNEPTVAIGPNQYCMMWDDRTSRDIRVAPVDPQTGQKGFESIIDSDATFAIGIAGSNSGRYLALYTGSDPSNLQMQLLDDCYGDPSSAQPASLIDRISAVGVLSHNPTSDTFGLAIQSGPTGDNYVVILDSSGQSVTSQYIPFSAGKDGNFWPVIEPNPATGTFAAVTSEDLKTVKFNSGMGQLAAAPFPQQPGSPQSLTINNAGLPEDLGQFISAIFIWSLRLIGLIIFVRFFWAGFKWFTAAGNSGRISDAKDIMKNAVLGAVVLFAAYLILYSVNPDLVKGALNLPGISDTATPAAQTTDVCIHSGFCQNNEPCTVTSEGATKRNDTCTDSGDSCGYFVSGTCKNQSAKSCSTDTDCNK